MRKVPLFLFLAATGLSHLHAQIHTFPYTENFDSVTVPNLPPDWITSTQRFGTGDFVTTTSSPHSAPNAAFSQNSTIPQYLVSPRLDFSGKVPDKLQYWTSRSSTHTSGVLVEASINDGATFPIVVSDTLRNPGNTSYNLISLNLPSSLTNESQVKLRWRIIGGTGGTSGTFRIDDVSITAKTAIDLAVQSVTIIPPFPLVSDTVTITIKLANLGVQIPPSYTLELFDDANRDSVGQETERIARLTPPPINSGDSSTIQTSWSGFSSGEHQVLALVTAAGDENAANNRGIINFLAGLTPRLVVINEIMYAPASPEPEWVELFNTTTDSVNIKNWKITDNTGVKIAITTKDTYIPARGFIVLAADSAFFTLRPSIRRVIIFNLPTLNNTGDAVVLFDSRAVTMDSLTYTPSWGGSGGRSLERISPVASSTDQSNWGTSLDPSGSSPDRVNTLTQKDHDLAIKSALTAPTFPGAGDSITLIARVGNVGLNPAASFAVSFFEDSNADSIGQSSELITSVAAAGPLPPGDSASFSAQVLSVPLGDHRYLIIVEYAQDEEPFNNKKILLVTVGLPPKTVVINEIMYAPSGGEPEWIEIYNTSPADVNLKNWKLSNRITSTKYTITTSDVVLSPKGFAVITRDSLAFQTFHPSIQGLLFVNSSLPIALFSNSGDAVVIFDARNAPMDSVFYSPGWGGSGGKSLERIAPLGPSTELSNWGSSLEPAGSTPGGVNTLAQKDNDLAVRSITVSPAVPIAGNNLTLTAKIANVGTNPASSYAVSFFEDINADSVGQTNELIGRTAATSTLQPGDSALFTTQVPNVSAGEHRFIVSVEYTGDEGLLNNSRIFVVSIGLPPRSVVINEIMYGPTGGEPEWIEIYNTTSAEVNLKNWRISNRTAATKYIVSTTDLILRPKDYAVITKDASILNFHSSPPATLVLVPGLPTALLSNSGDAVVLYDSRTTMMDSLAYTPSWGGGNGKSLERMDFEFLSTDSTNWATSTDAEGSTPGKQNSVATLENDLKAVRVFLSQGVVPQPRRPLSVVTTIQNVGRQQAGGYVVKFYHDANRDSTLASSELIGTVTSTPTLQRRDSTRVQFTWDNPSSGYNRIAAAVDYSADLRSSNNIASADISIGFQSRALVIDEIMYAPLSNQAEWVELYNPSSSPVDLTNWTLSDMKDAGGKSNIFSITKAPVRVAPQGLAVISSDSTIFTLFPNLRTPPPNVSVIILNRSSFSLNNEGDDVIITDLVGTVIDSVRYSPSWHNPDISDATGISLERINPSLSSNDRRNWSSCVEKVGGTPGRQNSIFTTTLPSQTTLSISPNPFSPDGDGFEDFAVISYQLSTQTARIRLKVFDSVGRLVRTLASNELSGSRGQIIWDGLDDEKRRLRMGIYVIFLEAIDSSGGVVETVKAAAVIAGKL